MLRRGGSAKAKAKRTEKRRSLLNFVQLTDPQIADEMSPARVDFADPAGGEIKSSWRPQEALGLQVFDSVVRNVNANRASRVKQGNGKRARTGVRDHHGRPRRQPAAQRDALVHDRAQRRQRRPVLGQAGHHRVRQPVRRDARAHQRRRGGPQLHRRRRLRRLPRRARRPLRRLLRPGRGRADLRPVRGVPALPRPARGRPAPVPGGRPGHALVHLARQPRRPHPGQRARQRGPLPRDRRRLPEGVPQRAFDPKRFEGAARRRAVRRVRRPRLHRAADRRRQDRRAGPGPPRDLQARVPVDRRQLQAPRLRLHAEGRAAQVRRHRQLLRVHAQEGLPLHLARHRRRGRRPERQHRRPAVPLAQGRAALGQAQEAARDRLRPPHARDDVQHARPTSARASATRPTSPAATATRASRPRCTAAWPARTRSRRCSPPTRT